MDGAAGPSEVTQINDYFPFGLQFPKACGAVVVPENRYRFNGIEHIAELELDMAAFRSSDPTIGRWMQVDPIYKFNESGYALMANNPVRFIDPLGLDTISPVDLDPVIVPAPRPAPRPDQGIAPIPIPPRPVPVPPTITPPAPPSSGSATASNLSSLLRSFMFVGAILYSPDLGSGSSKGFPDLGNNRRSQRIALGVDHDLRNFAIQTQSISYKEGWGGFTPSVTSQGAYITAIVSMAEADPNLTFHFNLSLVNGGRLENSIHKYPSAITTAEFKTIVARYLSRTTFYTKSGTIYKPTKPFIR